MAQYSQLDRQLWLTHGAEYAFAAVAGFLSVDLQKLTSALSLIPLKVSMAAEIIAKSIKSNSGGRRNISHTFFTGGSEALLKQLPQIQSTCLDLTNKRIDSWYGISAGDIRVCQNVRNHWPKG